MLNIPLYHGWLTDPESPEVVAAIGSCSYNQLVEKIISQKNSKKEELMTEGIFSGMLKFCFATILIKVYCLPSLKFFNNISMFDIPNLLPKFLVKNKYSNGIFILALICEEFLERTAAQLTYHGLSELVTSVKEDEMCVFFRNNHFSTLYKYKVSFFFFISIYTFFQT